MYVYLDNFAGADKDVSTTCCLLTTLLMCLGLEVTSAKCLTPRQEITWVGVEFNTLKMTLKIAQQKVDETLGKELITYQEFDSLMGKLFHMIKCSPQTRPFLNHLLACHRWAEVKEAHLFIDGSVR